MRKGRRGQVRTYNEGNTRIVSNLGDSLQIRNVIPGVANRLHVDGLGLLVDSGLDILRLVAVDKLGVDA